MYQSCRASPATRDHTLLPVNRRKVNSAMTGRYSIYLPRWKGWVGLGGWLYTETVYLSAVTHPFQAVTGPDVKQSRRSRPKHYTTTSPDIVEKIIFFCGTPYIQRTHIRSEATNYSGLTTNRIPIQTVTDCINLDTASAIPRSTSGNIMPSF